jgi:glycosyltransferase involved in cell wall biosynthesis
VNLGTPIDISVIIPFRNAASHLARCLDSICEQSFAASRYEIIAVDNNSTDNSADVPRRYPRVRLLSETRPGPYAARNHGVRESHGQTLVFTDSDCTVSKRWLAAFAKGFENRKCY